MKLGAVDTQVPALQPWADQFGDGATAIRRTDGDADRGGGAVGVAVTGRIPMMRVSVGTSSGSFGELPIPSSAMSASSPWSPS
jgi:hypothetical protein